MGAVGLYAVHEKDGTEVMDNATMQEVSKKIGFSRASISNAISMGYSVGKRYNVERIDTKVSRADRELLKAFDETRERILVAGKRRNKTCFRK